MGKASFVDKSLWDAKRVHRHRVKNQNLEVEVEWNNPAKKSTWVDVFSLALQDPTEILKHAKNKHQLSQQPFKKLALHCVGDSPNNYARAHEAKTMAHGGKSYKFGVRVPFGVKQAMMLDKEMEMHFGLKL